MWVLQGLYDVLLSIASRQITTSSSSAHILFWRINMDDLYPDCTLMYPDCTLIRIQITSKTQGFRASRDFQWISRVFPSPPRIPTRRPSIKAQHCLLPCELWSPCWREFRTCSIDKPSRTNQLHPTDQAQQIHYFNFFETLRRRTCCYSVFWSSVFVQIEERHWKYCASIVSSSLNQLQNDSCRTTRPAALYQVASNTHIERKYKTCLYY